MRRVRRGGVRLARGEGTLRGVLDQGVLGGDRAQVRHVRSALGTHPRALRFSFDFEPAGRFARAQEQGQAKAMSVADMVKEIRGYFERAGAPPSAADRKLLTFKGHEEELLNDLRRKAQPAPTPPAPKTDVDDEDWDDDWDDVEGEDDDEDEPEILRFSMEKAKSLMSHRLKHQLVLFMSEKDKRSGKAVEQLEEALKKGGYADKALGLHIPTDIRENDQVLDRFFVTPKKTPALRLAVSQRPPLALVTPGAVDLEPVAFGVHVS